MRRGVERQWQSMDMDRLCVKGTKISSFLLAFWTQIAGPEARLRSQEVDGLFYCDMSVSTLFLVFYLFSVLLWTWTYIWQRYKIGWMNVSFEWDRIYIVSNLKTIIIKLSCSPANGRSGFIIVSNITSQFITIMHWISLQCRNVSCFQWIP